MWGTLGQVCSAFPVGRFCSTPAQQLGFFLFKICTETLQYIRNTRVDGPTVSGLWASGLGNMWRSRLQRGLGWPSPTQQRPRALGPGEAAHLTVACARLVHEGAVLTGPHGRGSSTRRAPNCTKLMEARKLHTNSACRVK